MSISATVIADSISEQGKRLTTFVLRYPRFIHAEFMTHRQISRNASSSRAIPTSKLIEQVLQDPAMPLHWGKNQKGMQATEENHEPVDEAPREEAWRQAARNAANWAERFHEAGYHKQIVNRILEPFTHISVIATATEWENFFALRAHEDAQPETRILAETMLEEMRCSKPRLLTEGEDHLPFIEVNDHHDALMYSVSHFFPGIDTYSSVRAVLRRVSAARCARVSYLTHDKKRPTIEQDLKLFERLAGAEPLHASPLEHQAWPCARAENIRLQGNFNGWCQFRKTFEGECGEYPI